MNRWIVRVVAALAVAFGLMLAVGLVLRSMVSGSAKDRLAASLGQRMGVPVTVQSAGFDLSQWFRLRPSVALEDVAVENPPGFHTKELLTAKRISAQVSLAALLHRTIEVRSLLIEQPRITVETNERGLTNIGEALKKISSTPAGGGGPGPASGGGPSLAIDDLALTSGSLAVVGGQAANISDIEIHLSDFSSARRCRLQASAKLFGGSSSTLKIAAEAGPVGAQTLPVDGTLSVSLALAEIPAAIRREQFGALLASPGGKSRASLEASIRGDLYGTVSGPAKLVFSDLLVGSEQHHDLPLSGEAPASFTAASLVDSPRYELKINGAKLRLGKGEWNGDADFQIHDSATSGSVRGAIRNVDINQLLSSLASADNKIQGVLAIPSFSLQFAGKNANQIRNSLRGSGKLSITQGRLAALDLVASLERALGQSQQATPGASGTTPFNTLAADLTIGQSKIDCANVVLDGPALRASGHGTIGFDESLNFELNAQVTGALARLVNTASLRAQSDSAELPFTITGAVGAVKVRPAIRKMATDTVKGLVDSFLKRKPK
jgi:uncharacterized protein involved in outer membrane biogenesis